MSESEIKTADFDQFFTELCGKEAPHTWQRDLAVPIHCSNRQTSPAGVSRPKQFRKAVATVDAMLLTLADGSGKDYALPPVTQTLPQAEILHQAFIATAAKIGPPPPVLTGCDEK
ncbi:MAG: hypothetical protein OXC05_10030 [Halieaceae bacterium]|nr:hypothetical protein [Halieaceae bacterium]